eukprot:jgi/Antlo1/1533/563
MALLSSKHLNCPAIYLSVPLKTHVDSVCFLLDHVAPFVYRLDFILVGEVHSECTLVWWCAAALCVKATQHMHSHAHHPLKIHRLFFIVCKCGESAVILPCVLSLHSCTHLRRLDDAPSSLSLFELRLTVRVDTRARM